MLNYRSSKKLKWSGKQKKGGLNQNMYYQVDLNKPKLKKKLTHQAKHFDVEQNYQNA